MTPVDRPEVNDAILVVYMLIRVVLVGTISGFLLLKALAFRRAGKFGDAMAKSNVAVAFAYLGTLMLLAGLDFFRTTPWVLGVSFVVMLYVVKAGNELKRLYGSWGELMHEARLTIFDIRDEWLAQPPGMRIATILLFVEFWAAVVLVEIKGTPQELTIPTTWVSRAADATPTPDR
jgi:hypothetical protein